MKKTLKITGMHCKSCEILLSEAIGDTGVKVLSASHSKGEIVVDLSGEDKMPLVKKAVEGEGYHLA
ncbi:MAG: cation transporter [Candidatus Diapherotrites archaeon]|nr:cation transporter [Candidatus Diapherotrites archaeon]